MASAFDTPLSVADVLPGCLGTGNDSDAEREQEDEDICPREVDQGSRDTIRVVGFSDNILRQYWHFNVNVTRSL